MKSIKITATALLCFLLFAFADANRTNGTFIQKSFNQKGCISFIIDNEFSCNPMGQERFRKSYLTDTLFKNFQRDECATIKVKDESGYYIRFYTDRSFYTFTRVSGRDEYFLTHADIQDENSNGKVLKGNNIIGLNYSKQHVSKVFNTVSDNFCDTLTIKSNEGSCENLLYFKENKIIRIVLNKYPF